MEGKEILRKVNEMMGKGATLLEVLNALALPCSKCGSKKFEEDEKGIYCKRCHGYLALKLAMKVKGKDLLATALKVDTKGNIVQKIGKELWETEVKFFKKLGKLAKRNPREAVLMLISGIRTKLDMIEFSLIDRFEIEGIKKTELEWSEVDPLLCLDMYVDSIIRKLLWLKQVAGYRSSQIKELRRKAKGKLK